MKQVFLTTPRGAIVKGKNGDARLVWNKNIERFNRQYDKAQIWLDNEVLKDCDPFLPAETLALQKSGLLGTTPGDGVVQWIAPYARYLYYGKVMAGPASGPKHATEKDLVFSKEVHPQAQAFWFEAAKTQNKNKWIKGAKKIAGGG